MTLCIYPIHSKCSRSVNALIRAWQILVLAMKSHTVLRLLAKRLDNYKQGGKHQHELSLLVYNMQIIQIKQFTNDVPKNQGESHISIMNNRKKNTVIPWLAIQAQNMNLRDTIIHVYQETQQECLSTDNSTNLETTIISIKEDKYINCGITAFADEGKTMHLWNMFLWIDFTNISLSQTHVTEESIHSATILVNPKIWKWKPLFF